MPCDFLIYDCLYVILLDILIVTDIYPAREAPIEGVSGRLVAEAARMAGHRNVQYIEKMDKLVDILGEILKANDMVITFGAGDIHKVASDLWKLLENRKCS